MNLKNIIKKPIVGLLTWEASMLVKKHRPKVIAITGSVGKTTAKDILYAGLRDHFDTRTAQKSFNSDIGVPLSIMDLENPGNSPIQWIQVLFSGVKQVIFSKSFPELLVLEVGAGAPNDIKKIATWLHPDISVFTALAETPVHIEFFESIEQLFNEKKSLALHTKQDGLILYNGNDELLKNLLSDIETKKATFVISDNIIFTKEGTTMNGETTITLPGVLGHQMMYPVAALVEIYKEFGIDVHQGITSLVNHYEPTPGRARIIQGIDETLLIDDAYNASPIAVKAALEVLGKFESKGRKLFVFGDMMELGDYAKKAHIDVALQSDFINQLVTVGIHSRDTHVKATQMGTPAIHFDTSAEAGEWLVENHKPGDTILFKSSRHSIKMEQAIVQMALPEEHHKLVQEYL